MTKVMKTRRGDTVEIRDRETGQVYATMSVNRCGTGVLALGVSAPTEVEIEHYRHPRDTEPDEKAVPG